jgi:hypothetical protein
LFIEEGPVVDLANARAARSPALTWKLLDEASRLDAYPLAL